MKTKINLNPNPLVIILLSNLSAAFASVHVAYFTSWSIYGRQFTPGEIPARSISILNYAFAKIVDNKIALTDPWADIQKPWPGDSDTQPFKGNFWQINHVLKAKYPRLRTVMSVGGWTLSNNFSPMSATEESRNTFAESCAEFINKYGFDGIEINWEYPVAGGQDGNMRSPSDKENFTLLLKKLREKLGYQKLLTASISANPEYLGNLQLKEIGQILDYLNVMTYDFAGTWDSRTGHQTNLFSTSTSKFSADLATRTLIQGGVPNGKIVIGIPMYGRAFANAAATNNGLSQPFSGAAPGTFESGILNYYDVQSKIKTGDLVRYEDRQARAIWAYGPQSKVFVTYDDTQTVKSKCEYVNWNRLGGIMSWELSQEGPGAPISRTIAKTLNIFVLDNLTNLDDLAKLTTLDD